MKYWSKGVTTSFDLTLFMRVWVSCLTIFTQNSHTIHFVFLPHRHKKIPNKQLHRFVKRKNMVSRSNKIPTTLTPVQSISVGRYCFKQYNISCYKNKMISWPSHLDNGNSCTQKYVVMKSVPCFSPCKKKVMKYITLAIAITQESTVESHCKCHSSITANRSPFNIFIWVMLWYELFPNYYIA